MYPIRSFSSPLLWPHVAPCRKNTLFMVSLSLELLIGSSRKSGKRKFLIRNSRKCTHSILFSNLFIVENTQQKCARRACYHSLCINERTPSRHFPFPPNPPGSTSGHPKQLEWRHRTNENAQVPGGRVVILDEVHAACEELVSLVFIYFEKRNTFCNSS